MQYKPDAIVHFAAESHVDRSIDDPTRFIETNVMGTAILLSEGYDYYKNSIDNQSINYEQKEWTDKTKFFWK